MHQQYLLPRVREACAQVLHGYLPHLKTARDSKASTGRLLTCLSSL